MHPLQALNTLFLHPSCPLCVRWQCSLMRLPNCVPWSWLACMYCCERSAHAASVDYIHAITIITAVTVEALLVGTMRIMKAVSNTVNMRVSMPQLKLKYLPVIEE